MARDRDRDRDRRRTPKDSGRRIKKKVCIFCKEHIDWVDYKDVNLLRRFMSDRGKIRARRVSGNCTQHQRDVAIAIKTARELALLPYTQRAVSERGPGGRGPRPSRDGARPSYGAPAASPAAATEEEAGDEGLEVEVPGAEVGEEEKG
jgi:small subunit ribosomal protein S18